MVFQHREALRLSSYRFLTFLCLLCDLDVPTVQVAQMSFELFRLGCQVLDQSQVMVRQLLKILLDFVVVLFKVPLQLAHLFQTLLVQKAFVVSQVNVGIFVNLVTLSTEVFDSVSQRGEVVVTNSFVLLVRILPKHNSTTTHYAKIIVTPSDGPECIIIRGLFQQPTAEHIQI